MKIEKCEIPISDLVEDYWDDAEEGVTQMIPSSASTWTVHGSQKTNSQRRVKTLLFLCSPAVILCVVP